MTVELTKEPPRPEVPREPAPRAGRLLLLGCMVLVLGVGMPALLRLALPPGGCAPADRAGRPELGVSCSLLEISATLTWAAGVIGGMLLTMAVIAAVIEWLPRRVRPAPRAAASGGSEEAAAAFGIGVVLALVFGGC